MRLGLLIIATLVVAGCGGGSDDRLRVFAAASLTEVFAELVDEFETATPGTDVQLVLSGSASLAAQVDDGAPVDVVATADAATMSRIVDSGRTASDPTVFATNRLAIAVPAGNPLGILGFDDLVARDLDVAVCAVEVPCGAYTEMVVGTTPLAPVSFERSVRGVMTKVLLGEVDAGIGYRTDVIAEPHLDSVPFPQAADVVAAYPIVVVDGGSGAGEFVDFVTGERGREILVEGGFGPP